MADSATLWRMRVRWELRTFMPGARDAMRIGRSARSVRSERSDVNWLLMSRTVSRTTPTTTVRKSRTFQADLRYELGGMMRP